MFQLFRHFSLAIPVATSRVILVLGLGVTLLAGCVGNNKAPPDGYCYRTLGAVDCYTTPETNRSPVGVIENTRPPSPSFEAGGEYAAQ